MKSHTLKTVTSRSLRAVEEGTETKVGIVPLLDKVGKPCSYYGLMYQKL